MNYDDPIVYPNQPGRAHLHTYFGNTGTNAYSTAELLRTTGRGSCAGGILNRSSYWMPSLLSNGTPLVPTEGFVYYKSGYPVTPNQSIHDIPAGLRMIAGSSSATSAQSFEIVTWSCVNGSVSGYFQVIPDCLPSDSLRLNVVFPQCWDGVFLDSTDHKSHLAYPTWNDGCPSSYPVAIPAITLNVVWRVPSTGVGSLRLSSDSPQAASGSSAHADFWEAWDPATRSAFVVNCIQAGKDCGVRQLNDGRALVDSPQS